MMQQQSRPKALEGWMEYVYLGGRRVCVVCWWSRAMGVLSRRVDLKFRQVKFRPCSVSRYGTETCA